MPSEAGKGSDWRKDFDYQKYWTNMADISGGRIPKAKKKKLKNGKVRYIYK